MTAGEGPKQFASNLPIIQLELILLLQSIMIICLHSALAFDHFQFHPASGIVDFEAVVKRHDNLI